MADLTHLSLFSGIGGLDLAAEWAGFRTVGQCEWADYPRKVLKKHWPGLPRWRDIRTLTKESFYEQTGLETVTVLSGGFPCQPFSTAGKRRGKEDDRYLWPEMLRVIQEIRPRWVVGENVAGIVSMALDTVLSDLENIGYTCEALIIPACAVDAPHRRDRCAIVAHSNDPQATRQREHGGQIYTEPAAERSGVCGSNVADTHSEGLERCEQFGSHTKTGRRPESHGATGQCGEAVSHTDNPRFQITGHEPEFQALQSENGIEFGSWWPAEPGLGGMADGILYWLDEPADIPRIAKGVKERVNRLKCLGNAVVPQQFHPIFRAIAELEAVG